MATSLENLRTALANVEARIVEVTAKPKPDYSLDGKSVSWSGYLNQLIESQAKLREAILAAEGPSEIHVRATT